MAKWIVFLSKLPWTWPGGGGVFSIYVKRDSCPSIYMGAVVERAWELWFHSLGPAGQPLPWPRLK